MVATLRTVVLASASKIIFTVEGCFVLKLTSIIQDTVILEKQCSSHC